MKMIGLLGICMLILLVGCSNNTIDEKNFEYRVGFLDAINCERQNACDWIIGNPAIDPHNSSISCVPTNYFHKSYLNRGGYCE